MVGGPGASRLTVVFLGNAPWSVPSLEALAVSSHRVALVVTRPPRPTGRGGVAAPTAVAVAARRLGLPVLEAATVREGAGRDAVAAAAPDVLAVVAYGELLPPEILRLARLAAVNVHFSLLPDLRGAAPVQRAILEGRAATGVTTMRMEAGLDTGPILAQVETPIGEDEDAGALGARLAALGGRLLVETFDALAAGVAAGRPQDEALATYAPKLTRDEERIDWAEPAERIARRIRALAPTPGAWTLVRGRRLKVLRASVAGVPAVEGEHAPGRVVAVNGRLAVTAPSARVIVLDQVVPEGRRAMDGAAFARGARLRDGEPVG